MRDVVMVKSNPDRPTFTGCSSSKGQVSSLPMLTGYNTEETSLTKIRKCKGIQENETSEHRDHDNSISGWRY
jgi:hypothetical protein